MKTLRLLLEKAIGCVKKVLSSHYVKADPQVSFLDKYPHVRFIIERDRQEIERAKHYEKMDRALNMPMSTPKFLQGKGGDQLNEKPKLTLVGKTGSGGT